jgi:hypothetical protein
MDYSLLMRMLNRVAHLNKQLQPRGGLQGTLVAEISDLNSLDEFHYKIRPAALGRAGVEDVGNVRMVHQRKRLSLGLKACDHAFRVHARLNQLEGDTPVDWFLLFCHENDATTAFANLLQQLVSTHTIARFFPSGSFAPLFAYHRCRRLFQESSRSVIRPEQSLYLATEIFVVSAGLIQKSQPFCNGKLNRFREEFDVASGLHASWPSISFSSQARENVQ